MAARIDPFGARGTFVTPQGPAVIYRLRRLEELGIASIDRLPYSLRILLENLLRHVDGYVVNPEDVEALARWRPGAEPREIAFMPARVVLQDFTGVPAVVDLAAMRAAMKRMGGDPKRINPLIPVDLVIDHSVQVDLFGTQYAFLGNVELEFERNRERYAFLRWAQKAFTNFRVVPPGTGIVHQVNLEYLARVVELREQDGELTIFPDTLVGTDSHTTMINGLGVLGWGVGGIEAEAVMLGQPYSMLIPEVVGFRLTGQLPEGSTATDLVLRVTEMLRQKGVVGKFVEFFGPGLDHLTLPDRATIANMSPEYGATMGFFPVDHETLNYLRGTGRDPGLIDRVERYCKEQGLFRTADSPDPEYSDLLELDMSTVEPSLAGPRRPQDRVPLGQVKASFQKTLREHFGRNGEAELPGPSENGRLSDGAVAIAAITSCTNTSNPSVMVGAGLLAKKAVERGLRVKPYVKTSMAPGSRVVTDYLEAAGLLPYFEALRFHVVGYGCTTCIGNSGQLPASAAQQVEEGDLVVAAVLSGNRNFEGRINPLVKANYLASPPLVIAYAIAGRMDIDLTTEPLGYDPNGQPVYLRDIWPSQEEIREIIERTLDPELFKRRYAEVFDGDERWQSLPVPEGDLYQWDEASTYIQEPPFFTDMPLTPPEPKDITGARVLVVLGDSITTDHISPAGAISLGTPAAQYLQERGVDVADFNTYGSRRGNHEVMMRGTFANIRLRNLLAPGTEGGWTRHLPDGEVMTIYDAALAYQKEGVPLLVLAGKEYGSGSSRDWAAKGPYLLGVRAVLAESFERIHRSNLIGMGILPLQFRPGENRESLGLDGTEVYDIEGIAQLTPGATLTVRARREDGSEIRFQAIARIDTPVELESYRHGGILQAVLRKLL
ncbi:MULTISPECIES: aconitate hydratase AcnA [Limnochorda]|uniref:aconitate hydratase AcnA n=1 Tax=Limnochorda TaxID=1676651 RepID=UPI0017BE637C|nr:aconitate hydratase AcnA [Limnochorda pilosa]MBO2487338.1 aconitate hydratase AcnA [Bacillota bacterium]MBO2519874.1 aconitate hydratase AcnA [Bacillota bacterium]NMA70757.1 aconitate hydratase AcnA [Bacillota bacterium]